MRRSRALIFFGGWFKSTIGGSKKHEIKWMWPKKPDEWIRWKRRFQQFLSASGLDKEEESCQISTLLYCLGDEAEGVLASTNISDNDWKKYKEVMAKLDEHFKVRKNTINRRDQQEGESAEEYVTAHHELIESANTESYTTKCFETALS